MTSPFVIVGGGLAAATAAEELRQRGYDGPIELVAAEGFRPYQRPPLSKEYLTGSGSLDDVFVHPEGWEAEHDVTLRTGVAALRIGDHVVELSDGSSLPFAKLLLATGARPRRLDLPGGDAREVRTFRTLDDADALRGALADGGRRVVLLGAGWIGMELAAAARGYGNEVAVIARGRVPLASGIGDELGLMYRRAHEEHGVVFRMDAAPTAIEVGADGAVTGVRLGDDDLLPADLVLVAHGVEPETALAETAGLDVDHGILVDERLRASAPDILAAGDVANPYHPVLRRRLRNEHWANAIAGGKVAASTMLDGDAVLDDIPYLYSDQYDVGMEYSGYPPLADGAQLVIRGDLAARELVAFWVRDGRVVAGMNVNVWDVNDQVQRLIRERVVVDTDRLADASVDLASLT
ncbi:NAD(P)/FAD-dependent oxidoreductase [Pseudolysinimonas sp.]|uniref:NAD(P)/FAD-dependent oxidoreductase n=1 Tax=Pseudolysinimonas sp. TaxID=2680009 RepID=UPI003F82243E